MCITHQILIFCVFLHSFKYILKNEQVTDGPWISLLQRIAKSFDTLFSKGDSNKLLSDLDSVNREFGQLACNLMQGQMDIKITPESLAFSKRMYNLERGITGTKKSINFLR